MVYNADLANGLGNLSARIAKLCERSKSPFKPTEILLKKEVEKSMEEFRFDRALESIWADIKSLDQSIEKTKPWELKGEELKENLDKAVAVVRNIALNLKPFLPETAEKIEKQFTGPKIKAERPLFPRLA